MEGKSGWHGKAIDDESFAQAMKELEVRSNGKSVKYTARHWSNTARTMKRSWCLTQTQRLDEAVFLKSVPRAAERRHRGVQHIGTVAVAPPQFGKIPFVNTFTVFLTTLGLLRSKSVRLLLQLPIAFLPAHTAACLTPSIWPGATPRSRTRHHAESGNV